MITISIIKAPPSDEVIKLNEWGYFDSIPQYHPIADANNLYEAFKAARKGSHWKTQVQRFRWNIGTELCKLQNELDNTYHGRPNEYELSKYSKFIVNERGKTRAITALGMRDRIVKHCLNDVFLIPHIRQKLIYDNGASLKGKGISFTRNRLLAHLESYFREYGTNHGYIMTMDFSGYYDNIDHERVKQMIRQYENDPFAIYLADQAFDSYRIDVSYMTDHEYELAKHTKFSMVEYRKDHLNENRGNLFLYKSLSVGDQTSQIAAIAFPTLIDKDVTIVCGHKYYGRYMDDLYVIAPTINDLIKVKERIEEDAKYLRIFVNPHKTRITPLDRTFTYLQYKYYLKDNGYVVIRINKKTVRRMRHKLKKLSNLVKTGKARLIKVEEMFRSWIANYGTVMSKKQRNNLIALYQEQLGNGIDEWLLKRGLIERSKDAKGRNS